MAYIVVTTKELHKYNIQAGGTEGLVNEPMKIADIKVSILIKEDEGKVKMSFRSKDKIDVSSFARTYFNGGGHLNAAGGVSFKSLRETEKDLLKYLKDFNID
ncbi:MAG: DHHA1 domain-containing protein [Chitinophagales bacterium]|nr:DHHA1 domain-containing protein [Chitinophagales bacterium]